MTTGYGGGLTLSYDEENRLVSAGSVSYTYDLQGRRITRSIGGSTTTYVWDGAHIIAEYLNGSLTKKYIYGPGMDNPIAMINVDAQQNETWYYYYTDNLGSIRLLTDSGGNIKESYTYLVYGWPYVMYGAGNDGNWLTEDVTTTYSSSASGIDNPYMFTGRRWDSTSQLYYYRFRDYAPAIGRFMQTDPIGYYDSMNLYQYCGNNPVNWVDPWGLAMGRDPLNAEDSMLQVYGDDAVNAAQKAKPRGWWQKLKDLFRKRWGELRGKNLTRQQQKSIRSYQNQIAKHKQKLSDYARNPDKYDNKGYLKNASKELRKKIIEARKQELKRQIKVFEQNIEKVKNCPKAQ